MKQMWDRAIGMFVLNPPPQWTAQNGINPMTTSSEHSTPASPRPSGRHWSELTATLSAESTLVLDQWLDDDLQRLERELHRFVTPNSLKKSLRR